MYTAVTVLIMIVCLLLALVVLVQNAKGGGLAAGFSASNQVMGVRKTTDVLEKLTWGLAIALMVFCITGTVFMPKAGEDQSVSVMQEQIDNAALPTPAGSQPPIGGGQPAENAAAEGPAGIGSRSAGLQPGTETP